MEARTLGTAGNLTEDREPFFVLDDVEYTLPRKVPSRIALQFLEMQSEGLDSELVPWIINQVVGNGAYEALRDSDSVDTEELVWVFEQVSERVTGGLEKAQGKSGNGTRRSAGS